MNAHNGRASLMTRFQRKAIGQSTISIIEAGHYSTDAGAFVDVGQQMRESIAATSMTMPGAPQLSQVAETVIDVVNEGTLGASLKLHREGYTPCALNFASARNPGGGFANGAEAQEENIARNSMLYATLTSPAATPFYEHHNALRHPLYSDLMIYSPLCPVIRDEWTGELLDEAWPLSFVTAAAPNAGNARKQGLSEREISATLEKRAELVLRLAHGHGHDALVLGAWGCGVFQNQPTEVARVFASLLRGPYRGVFRRVTFAVVGPATNRAAFLEAFGDRGSAFPPAAAPLPRATRQVAPGREATENKGRVKKGRTRIQHSGERNVGLWKGN